MQSAGWLMFDVGFAELLLLSVIGLLVLGPERLPRVARTLGGFARKARRSWMSLKRTIEAEIRAEEFKQPLKRFENEIKSAVDSVKSGVDSLKDPLKNLDPTAKDSTGKPNEPNDGT
ncbi:MAG: twin-arginine translocase subunit TatB [Proteobacteria bacterium]|nr:twin-arginine translocase subunit TatB [Pseudomonadota bacterium]MCH8057728.1 twin-arginine translocase subunit TatB [Pseudomonadota bacterium]